SFSNRVTARAWLPASRSSTASVYGRLGLHPTVSSTGVVLQACSSAARATATRDGADNPRLNFKGMALEQDSLTEADSISVGVALAEGESWDEQAEQRRCEVPAALHGSRLDRALV